MGLLNTCKNRRTNLPASPSCKKGRYRVMNAFILGQIISRAKSFSYETIPCCCSMLYFKHSMSLMFNFTWKFNHGLDRNESQKVRWWNPTWQPSHKEHPRHLCTRMKLRLHIAERKWCAMKKIWNHVVSVGKGRVSNHSIKIKRKLKKWIRVGEGVIELFPANIAEIGLHLIVTNSDNTKCSCKLAPHGCMGITGSRGRVTALFNRPNVWGLLLQSTQQSPSKLFPQPGRNTQGQFCSQLTTHYNLS